MKPLFTKLKSRTECELCMQMLLHAWERRQLSCLQKCWLLQVFLVAGTQYLHQFIGICDLFDLKVFVDESCEDSLGSGINWKFKSSYLNLSRVVPFITSSPGVIIGICNTILMDHLVWTRMFANIVVCIMFRFLCFCVLKQTYIYLEIFPIMNTY